MVGILLLFRFKKNMKGSDDDYNYNRRDDDDDNPYDDDPVRKNPRI